MKKLLFVVSAITAFSLLALGTSSAEPTHPNEVGLYMTPDGYGATGTYVIDAPVEVYMVLTKPADVENGDAPYTSINAFALSVSFNPIPNNNLFFLGADLPPGSIDIGLRKDINQGVLDFFVGIPFDVPVTDESVVLATLYFFNMTTAPTAVTLGPEPRTNIEGQMIYQSEEGEIRVMHSVGGSHDAPVFIFNGEAVAVENESFGSVKALYR